MANQVPKNPNEEPLLGTDPIVAPDVLSKMSDFAKDFYLSASRASAPVGGVGQAQPERSEMYEKLRNQRASFFQEARQKLEEKRARESLRPISEYDEESKNDNEYKPSIN